MFALHETTQRRFCRVLFLVGCLGPALLTLSWIAYWHRPWRQADWQQSFKQQLHIRAQIEGIVAPQPGIRVIRHLKLADLRTDKLLGSVDRIVIEHQNSKLILQADHLEVRAEQLPAIVSAAATWLATGAIEPIEFRIQRMTVADLGRPSVELRDVQVSRAHSIPSIQRFRLIANAVGDSSQPLQLDVEHQKGHLRTKLDLQHVTLPAWLIGKLVPGVAGCGEASFSGVITAVNLDQRTQGNLQGRLEAVDLQQWAAASSPHRLQCVADVMLDKLTWSDHIIEFAQGKIEARSSAASYSLFRALADSTVFRCGVGRGWESIHPTSPEELIAFDRLAVGFQMSKSGILLRGECVDGALMVAPSGPLLFDSSPELMLPVASLVQLLHSPQKNTLPATREAHEMAGGLPLPGTRKPENEILTK